MAVGLWSVFVETTHLRSHETKARTRTGLPSTLGTDASVGLYAAGTGNVLPPFPLITRHGVSTFGGGKLAFLSDAHDTNVLADSLLRDRKKAFK